MAWIEHRRSQYLVYERTADGRKAYEPFATREDAELFIAFVAQSGWDAAVASVLAPAPSPPPPGLRAAGVSVGELVTWHVDRLVGVEEKNVDQYRSYVRHYVDPFFGDIDAGSLSGGHTRLGESVP